MIGKVVAFLIGDESVLTTGEASGVEVAVVCVEGGNAPSRLCIDWERFTSNTESETLDVY